MRCHDCQKVLAGVAFLKRAEYRTQEDESVKIFGVNMPDGPLAKAEGRLLMVKDSKCYWAEEKRVRRARAGTPAPAAQAG